MLVLATMGGLYLVVSRLGQASSRQDIATAQALKQAKDALIGYAITYRDTHSGEVFGYLPCPDTDGDGESNASDGVSCGNTTDGKAVIGLLPFKTLGLPDLRDKSGNCLWYAVSGGYKAAANKAVPMNWDTQGQFLIRDLNNVTLAAPGDSQGGAAAVIFAVGPPLSGQNRKPAANLCGVDPAQFAAYVDGNIAFPSADSASLTLAQGAIDSATNNDRLIWLTPKEIFGQIKKRNDFAGQINTLATEIKNRLSLSLPPVSSTSYASFELGNVPPITIAGDYLQYLANWSDHFRYALCHADSPNCLSINGAACDGALFFGGADVSGNPRPGSTRALANYFESGGALPLATGISTAFNGSSAYSAVTPANDVGLCIATLSVVTFAQNIGQFQAVNGATPVAAINTASKTVTLGKVGGVSNVSGCVWYPTPTPFLGGMRIYFRFNIANKGDGFTFVIADANPSRNPSPLICGGAGPRLGYAGSVAGVAPIKPPKIAIEFDLRRDAGIDPVAPFPASHVAFDYWGTLADADDDNVHGAGSGAGSEPANPVNTAAVPPGVTSLTMNTGTDYHVRLDINRSYNAGTAKGSYTLTAYVASSFAACDLFSFQTFSDDLVNIEPACTRKIAASLVIDDPADNFGEAMKNIHFGFSNAQSATQDQNITIHDLRTQTHP